MPSFVDWGVGPKIYLYALKKRILLKYICRKVVMPVIELSD